MVYIYTFNHVGWMEECYSWIKRLSMCKTFLVSWEKDNPDKHDSLRLQQMQFGTDYKYTMNILQCKL